MGTYPFLSPTYPARKSICKFFFYLLTASKSLIEPFTPPCWWQGLRQPCRISSRNILFNKGITNSINKKIQLAVLVQLILPLTPSLHTLTLQDSTFCSLIRQKIFFFFCFTFIKDRASSVEFTNSPYCAVNSSNKSLLGMSGWSSR